MVTSDCEHLASFPSICMRSDSCVIRASHGRLREAHRHWHDALSQYDDLDGLRTYLNGTIQALRNVTFTLQASKSAIPQFDEWYGVWQAAFKADPVMRWAVESRNRIVKNSDLETKSRAKAVLLGSIDGKPTTELEVTPSTANGEIVARLMRRLSPSESLRRDGIVEIERRWIDNQLPGMEILDALGYVFGRLAQLLADCHTHFKQPERSSWRTSTVNSAVSSHAVIDVILRPICMVAFDDQRKTWIRTLDGDEVALIPRPAPLEPESIDSARDRYGEMAFQALGAALSAQTLEERARAYWNTARLLMEKDGYHASIVHLYRDGVPVAQSSIELPDNAAKLVYWDELRRLVEKTGATEIVAVSERWQAQFDPSNPDRRAADAPDRREILGVDALNSKGQSISIFGCIDRVEGVTSVGEAQEIPSATLYYLDEVRRAWGLPLGTQMNELDVSELEKAHAQRVFPATRRHHSVQNVTIGRNDPCPCGSGKKFKKCCLRKWPG